MKPVKNVSNIEVRLRDMVEDDLAEVVRLERKIFPDPWPRSAFTLRAKDNEGGALIAESDGQVIGYACFLIAGGECHLANIAVDPEHRRKSVAKQLLGRILEIASVNACELILLEVRVSNKEAIAFYHKFGFEELYCRPKYYHSPVEDALIMIGYLNQMAMDE